MALSLSHARHMLTRMHSHSFQRGVTEEDLDSTTRQLEDLSEVWIALPHDTLWLAELHPSTFSSWYALIFFLLIKFVLFCLLLLLMKRDSCVMKLCADHQYENAKSIDEIRAEALERVCGCIREGCTCFCLARVCFVCVQFVSFLSVHAHHFRFRLLKRERCITRQSMFDLPAHIFETVSMLDYPSMTIYFITIISSLWYIMDQNLWSYNTQKDWFNIFDNWIVRE